VFFTTDLEKIVVKILKPILSWKLFFLLLILVCLKEILLVGENNYIDKKRSPLCSRLAFSCIIRHIFANEIELYKDDFCCLCQQE